MNQLPGIYTKPLKKRTESDTICTRSILAINDIVSKYHDKIIREIEDTMSCSVMNTADKLKIIDYTLSLCPGLDLTRIAADARDMCILHHLHKIDTNKTINYNDVFDAATYDEVFITRAVFAIQHGATNWDGCDDNEHIDAFIKGGAGRILDEYPKYRQNSSAKAYIKIRRPISRLLKKIIIPVVAKLIMDYLPYERPELTSDEWEDLSLEFDVIY